MIPCSVDVEVLELAVGRGIALVDADLQLAAAPCQLEPVPSLVAREEGRAAPEIVLLVLTDGPRSRSYASRLPPHFVVTTRRVRVSALLRGERFAAVPIALSHDARGAAVSVRTRSTWGARATAGDARFVEHGLPALVTVDPLHDHAPLVFETSLAAGYARTVVLDAGPRFGGPPERHTPALRAASLSAGGADAASVLATDLPLAILSAPTTDEAAELVDEAAHAARAAAKSKDPLLSALGHQLAAGLVQGFQGCVRPVDLVFVEPPPVDLDDGCPHVEQDAALPNSLRARARAALLDDKNLPRVGPRKESLRLTTAPRRRRGPWIAALLCALALAFGWLAQPGLAGRGRAR